MTAENLEDRVAKMVDELEEKQAKDPFELVRDEATKATMHFVSSYHGGKVEANKLDDAYNNVAQVYMKGLGRNIQGDNATAYGNELDMWFRGIPGEVQRKTGITKEALEKAIKKGQISEILRILEGAYTHHSSQSDLQRWENQYKREPSEVQLKILGEVGKRIAGGTKKQYSLARIAANRNEAYGLLGQRLKVAEAVEDKYAERRHAAGGH